MAAKIWVNIGSGNGLLPDGTKPLPEAMLTYQVIISEFLWHLTYTCKSNFTVIVQATVLCDEFVKSIFLKLLPHLPGVNELKLKCQVVSSARDTSFIRC